MPIEKLTAERILELFRQGYTVERIKKEFGGSKDRIRKYRPTDQSTARPNLPVPVPVPRPDEGRFHLPIELFRAALKQNRIGIHLKSWLKEQVEWNDSRN